MCILIICDYDAIMKICWIIILGVKMLKVVGFYLIGWWIVKLKNKNALLVRAILSALIVGFCIISTVVFSVAFTIGASLSVDEPIIIAPIVCLCLFLTRLVLDLLGLIHWRKESGASPFFDQKTNRLLIASITASFLFVILAVSFIIIVPIYKQATIDEGFNSGKYNQVTTAGENAFKYGSVNKNYTVYLLSKNGRYYMFQFVGNEMRVYSSNTSATDRTKASILNYFTNVKEEIPPTGLLVGGLLVVAIVVPIVFFVGSCTLWVLYCLEKKKERLLGEKIV